MRHRRLGCLVLVLVVAACGPGPVEVSSPPATSAAPPAATAAVAPPTPAPASSAPAQRPSPAATPSATALGVVRIPFARREMVLTIVGEPGLVTAWRAATEREVERMPWGEDADFGLVRLADRTLLLAWIGTVCDLEATLSVARDRLEVSPAPREACDLVGVPRGVVLTYAEPVDPTSVSVVLDARVLLPEGS
jgi:hypothetical protein